MERGFNPRNIAVVGAARHNNFGWLRRHETFQRLGRGHLFHVNIDREEWPGAEKLGYKAYASLLDIPDPIDYVTVSVPPKVAPRVLQDCISRNVPVVHFFTAGFFDAGTAEGAELERTLVRMARDSGTLIIGPNCLGVYNPAFGIRQSEDLPSGAAGDVGYISSSGGQSIGFVTGAAALGIRVSKSFSIGNGADLDVPDYLYYLGQDSETKVIGMYVEGMKDLSAFAEALKFAAERKPVLVWKVGRTEDAARATQAHTGSHYVSQSLWTALVQRCGAISVQNLEEMLTVVHFLLTCPPLHGDRLGLVATSGGHASEMADVFASCGFRVPSLSAPSLEQFSSFFNVIGGSYRNPIEGSSMNSPERYRDTLAILLADENIDGVVVELRGKQLQDNPRLLQQRIQVLKEASGRTRKPLVVALTTTLPYVSGLSDSLRRSFIEEGLPVSIDFETTAAALYSFAHYQYLSKYGAVSIEDRA